MNTTLQAEIIDWNNMDFQINDHCTVGELLKNDHKRIPVHKDVQENLVALATSLKFLKMRSQIPFVVTLGYMPSKMARFRGYANEYTMKNDIFTESFCALLSYIDYCFETNLYERFGTVHERWTRRHPITQGRYLAIVPIYNDEGDVRYELDSVLKLFDECQKYWNGEVELSRNKMWINLSI